MTDHPTPRIAVIGGGANDEHDVSLASAAAVTRAVVALGLDPVPLTIARDGSWHLTGGRDLSASEAVGLLTTCDAAFPVLHGVNGEDGAVAGLLELAGVPQAGSPVRAGALAIDKWVTKLIAAALGIATAPGALVHDEHDPRLRALALPCVVKPTTGGSSNGVSVVHDHGGLIEAVRRARRLGDAVLVEQYIQGREIDIALFRSADGTLRAGATLEIARADGAVFDREQKYDGTAGFTVPAPIAARDETAVRAAATALYETLGCRGIARFDFFLTGAGLVLNEVNTAPGLTERSQVPRMYAHVGLGYEALIAAALDAVLDARIPAGIDR